MPAIVAWIGSMLLTVAGELAIRSVVSLGVALTAYAVSVSPARSVIADLFSQAGPLADYIGWLGIDVSVTIILSAAAGRAVVDSSKAYFTKRAG